LGQPRDVGATVHHAHRDLEDEASLPATGRVGHRDGALSGGRHESKLNATTHAVRIGLPELVGQQSAGDATVYWTSNSELAKLQLKDNTTTNL